MVRSLINVGLGPGPTAGKVVLDCFAGSGTALLEAALLGAIPVGVDIDPLSALISRVKLSALSLDPAELEGQVSVALSPARVPLSRRAGEPLPGASFALPSWLARKMTPGDVADVVADVEALRAGIGAVSGADARALLQVLLSDALTRKLRMRFLGTGVGRFALDLHRASVVSLFEGQARRMCHSLEAFAAVRRLTGLGPLPRGEVIVGDATALALPDELADFVVTSPPYLPASSGRETYTKGRAASLLALDLMDDEEIEALGREAVGSMIGIAALPEWPDRRVLDLVAWLQRDELRSIKALPTARYFVDMQRAFEEMLRILGAGRSAAVVVAREHQFYRFRTRETLYRVPIAEMLLDGAGRAGFADRRSIDVELEKRHLNARPRSLDQYFESILLMRRPPSPADGGSAPAASREALTGV
jgi:hypothetical protein